MSKPAAFLGVYTDLKFMSGLKVARVTLEIPIERSQEFIGMFGTPDKANPAWCAIARMDVEALKAPAVPETPSDPAPVVKAETKRSSRAHLKCHEPAFQAWLEKTYPFEWGMTPHNATAFNSANMVLKEVLGVASKSEFDTDPHKAAAWDALVTDFELRDLVR